MSKPGIGVDSPLIFLLFRDVRDRADHAQRLPSFVPHHHLTPVIEPPIFARLHAQANFILLHRCPPRQMFLHDLLDAACVIRVEDGKKEFDPRRNVSRSIAEQPDPLRAVINLPALDVPIPQAIASGVERVLESRLARAQRRLRLPALSNIPKAPDPPQHLPIDDLRPGVTLKAATILER